MRKNLVFLSMLLPTFFLMAPASGPCICYSTELYDSGFFQWVRRGRL
jgi:ABC-type multidrug transport system permease subunit